MDEDTWDTTIGIYLGHGILRSIFSTPLKQGLVNWHGDDFLTFLARLPKRLIWNK